MTKCARCGYGLDELPNEHRCPECGLPFDSSAILIPFSLGQRQFHQLACVAILLGLVGYGVIRRGFERIDAWIIAFALLSTGVASFRILTRRGAAAGLSLSHEGLLLESDGSKRVRVPWSSVRGAKYGWFLGRCRVFDTVGAVLLTLSPAQVGGRRVTRRCTREVNRMRDVYRAQFNKPDGPTSDPSEGGRVARAPAGHGRLRIPEPR